MADNYSHGSFIIPCSKEQAEIALAALAEIDGDIEEKTVAMLNQSDDDTFSDQDKITRHCFFNHDEYNSKLLDYANAQHMFCWRFLAIPLEIDFNGEHGILVSHDENIDSYAAAVFAQSVLKTFESDQAISITIGYTCSKPIPGAFGGHALFVTKDHISHHCDHDFTTAETKAHENQARYFFCQVTEVNGEVEYNSKFLMEIREGDCPDRELHAITLNIRGNGEGEVDESGVVRFGSLAVRKPIHKEIMPLEFQTMGKYLSVLKPNPLIENEVSRRA